MQIFEKDNKHYRKDNLKRNKINDNVIKNLYKLRNFANHYFKSRFEISFRSLKNYFHYFKN